MELHDKPEGPHTGAIIPARVLTQLSQLNKKRGLSGLEWVILEVENPTKLGIARGFCILAKAGIRHE
jgi:hypothetical protein